MPPFSPERLREPAIDYREFLSRGYPESSLKKLVGDRYRLTGEERLILYRGVCTPEADARRSAKRASLSELRGTELAVDFYNIAFTLLNYLLGRPLFTATDGYVRDAGALHGRVGKEERLSRILQPILDTLRPSEPQGVTFYLDAPVSHSREHAAQLEQACREHRIHAASRVVQSADYPLKAAGPGVVATGDSAIIDATPRRVVDLSAETLRQAFNFTPPALGELLSGEG